MCGRVPHFTGGTLTGHVRVHGRDTRDHRPRDLADLVGVVGQDPLAGFVTDTVEEELAYGMEQLGLPPATMRKRVEETLDLLGIAELRDVPLRELSGGQQQRVAIGSVLTAHPRVHPARRADLRPRPDRRRGGAGHHHPAGARPRRSPSSWPSTGSSGCCTTPTRVVHVSPSGEVRSGLPSDLMVDSDIAPPVVELGRYAGWSPLPLSVRDARRAAGGLRDPPGRRPAAPGRDRPAGQGSPTDGRRAVRRGTSWCATPATCSPSARVDLDLHPGEVIALMGRNGCGKSSLLWALQGSGLLTSGTVRAADAGLADTVEPSDAGCGRTPVTGGAGSADRGRPALPRHRRRRVRPGRPRERRARRHLRASCSTRLAPGIPAEQHPRDLSEGQKLALVLAVQLTADPPVLLLDEPTRGLDYRRPRRP